MARMVDVQIMRSRSQRTASSGTTSSSLAHTEPPSGHDRGGDANISGPEDSELMHLPFPVAGRFAQLPLSSPSPRSPMSPSPTSLSPTRWVVPQKPVMKVSPPAAANAAATGIQEIEQGLSLNQHHNPPIHTTKIHDQRIEKPGVTPIYGLVQKPSLFVANPDHRKIPSTDSETLAVYPH